MKRETLLINSVPVDPLTGAISVPIYQTSTFVQEAPGVNKGFDYTRSGNPTRLVLENMVAQLESGHAGFAFASGLAAIDSIIKLLSYGDEILAIDDIYGGTYRLFEKLYKKFGINVKYVDLSAPEQIEAALTERTKMIWLESPTNPTMKITDIEAVARISKKHGVLLVVDNTFCSPAIQKPLELGADIVVHSATKYLAGHSDVMAGVVITSNEALSQEIGFIQNASGGILSPFDSWLVIRGLETLFLRIEKQSINALVLAEFLTQSSEVRQVYYPGLSGHPNHDIASKQQQLFGGVLSFDLHEDTVDAAERIVKSTSLLHLAESLGGVKSLICHPASMTHASLPAYARRRAGINDSLIRVSCGVENSSDLINDLDRALEKVSCTLA